MTAKPKTAADPEKAEEARHVAEDALEAKREGNTEEARFLAGEAKSLDPQAAEDVLGKSSAGKKEGKT